MLFRILMLQKPIADPDDLTRAMTFREVLDETKLEHHARHFAIKAEPPVDHHGLTVPENDALDFHGGRNEARQTDLGTQVLALKKQVQLVTTNTDSDPAILHHRTADAVISIFKDRAPAIRETMAMLRTRTAQLAAWRHEHDVSRPAEYPTSRLNHFRWLAVVGAGEAVAQSTLLMPATPDGMVGAIGLAAAVTGLTTLFGVLLGFVGLRYLSATSLAQRCAAWLSLPVLAGVPVIVSFYVAHYRHVAGMAVDTPNDAQVIEHLLTQTFDLTGPGWLLLALALACPAFAAWKGYTASDPIPGYEKVDRAYVAASDDREYVRKDMQSAITAVNTATIKPLIDRPRVISLQRQHLLNLATELEAKSGQIAALAKQEGELVERAIAHFRRVNLATRADGVTPAYFAEPVVIPASVASIATGLKVRVDAATASAVAEATRTAEAALTIARMLDMTSDRADEIMASIDRAEPVSHDNPILDLRSKLRETFDAAALPSPESNVAIAPPTAATKS